MILFVSGGPTETLLSFKDHPNVGKLAAPRGGNGRDSYEGWTWAADNGAFAGFDEGAFLRLLKKLHGLPDCRFVACPDVVGDAEATLDLFSEWGKRLRADGWPVALVAQDGLTESMLDWDSLDALFIGGTTAWKYSSEMAALSRRASSLGKWVHMGRVNGFWRIDYARAIACDSIDGTQWGRFANKYLQKGLDYLAEPRLQLEFS